MAFWLMKSEPETFSYSDLVNSKDQTTHWEGVRNYQARNMMRDDMKRGDTVLFYHSRVDPPHIAGIAEVTREGYPDHTALDATAKYFDAKSDPENPRWFMVDIRATRALSPGISLDALKANPALVDMKVVQKGQRLSVQPVQKSEFDEVIRMEEAANARGVTSVLLSDVGAAAVKAKAAAAKTTPVERELEDSAAAKKKKTKPTAKKR